LARRMFPLANRPQRIKASTNHELRSIDSLIRSRRTDRSEFRTGEKGTLLRGCRPGVGRRGKRIAGKRMVCARCGTTEFVAMRLGGRRRSGPSVESHAPAFPCPQFACPRHRRWPFPRPSFKTTRSRSHSSSTPQKSVLPAGNVAGRDVPLLGRSRSTSGILAGAQKRPPSFFRASEKTPRPLSGHPLFQGSFVSHFAAWFCLSQATNQVDQETPPIDP
jgi:hypothetical protein